MIDHKLIRYGKYTSFFAVFILLIFIPYYPSLDHLPRADHWAYLVDTIDNHSLANIFESTYSFNRTRTVEPGDVALFRPILFLLLAFEKSLFGAYDYKLWQAFGVFLHGILSFLCFCLMYEYWSFVRFERSKNKAENHQGSDFFSQVIGFLLPLCLSLYFALNYAIQEMVLWSHINGYILFLIFILASLLSAFKHLKEKRTGKNYKRSFWFLLSWTLALLSAFTYELGQVFVVFIGLLFLFVNWQKYRKPGKGLARFLAFLSIAFIYQAINWVDYNIHLSQGHFIPDDTSTNNIFGELLKLQTLTNSFRFVRYTIFQPLCTACAQIGFNERLSIEEIAHSDMRFIAFIFILTGILFCSTIFFVYKIRGGKIHCSQLEKMYCLTIFSGLLFYGFINVAGRLNLRANDDLILSNNSYYSYIPLLFLILIGFSIIVSLSTQASIPLSQKTRKFIALLCVSLCLSLTLYNGFLIYSTGRKISEHYQLPRSVIQQITSFVDEHRHEEGFSVAFDIEGLKGYDRVFTRYSIPITTILFRKYENVFSPRYVISFLPSLEMEVSTLQEYRASQSQAQNQVSPLFVDYWGSYNIFFYDGEYIGLLHWDGVYDPNRENYHYHAKASSLGLVKDKIYTQLLKQRRDIKLGKFSPPDTSFSISLVKEGYQGFNIIKLGMRFYAIPQGEGGFDLRRINIGDYSQSFIADSESEVLQEINQAQTLENIQPSQ